MEPRHPRIDLEGNHMAGYTPPGSSWYSYGQAKPKPNTVYAQPVSKPSPYPKVTYATPQQGGSGLTSATGRNVSLPTTGQLFTSTYNRMPKMPSIADEFAKSGPSQIKGLPGTYFDLRKAQLRDELERQFFGPVGQVQQVASQESAAGRLGSGVGKRIIEETAMRPFADASVNLERGIEELRLQEAGRVETYNADQLSKYNEVKSSLRYQDQGLQLQQMDLAERVAQADAGLASQQALAQLESDLRIWEASLTDLRKEQELELEKQRLAIEFIRSPVDVGDAGGGTVNQLSNYFGQ